MLLSDNDKKNNKSEYASAEVKGYCLIANLHKYWSSLDTTKAWFLDIIILYRQNMINEYNLACGNNEKQSFF